MSSAPTFQVRTRPSVIEHEDGVVADALHHHPELVVGAEPPQTLFLGAAAFAEVARHLGESDQLPGLASASP